MAGEIPDLKTKARRVKNLALTKAIEILEHPEKHDKDVYKETYLTALKNSVPRTQEITGEEGSAISIVFDQAFKQTGEFTRQTETDSNQPSEV
jgi:uncharacterized protein YnzC (UPF0291/DUF896 family)